MKRTAPGRLFVAFLILVQSAPARAAADAFQFFEEEAKVVTATRRSQSISESPVAIDVVTAEEIRASGALHLWDLLRYRVGMNVIDGRSSSGNRAIVAIRGFAERYTRNVLVLVDGRKVLSPLNGGTDWDQLPVQIQDIARIEIIRGPNAALYGSGAGLGVINIITTKPDGVEGAAADVRAGDRGTVQAAESVESSVKRLSFRLSHEYRQEGDRDAAAGTAANDFFHSHKANFRAHWNAGRDTEIEAYAGGSWTNAGVPAAQSPENRYAQHYEAARVIRAHGKDASTEFFTSRSETTSRIFPGAAGGADRDVVVQYEEQVLHRRDWAEGRLQSTFGADYQSVRADSPTQYAGHSSDQNGRA
ncbi:MAG: TonB-dependent receptor, partial [Elusimicrobia bacterium]|nr:TonB-dependent receptor [Elusimicrobiota bacterium]